MDVLTTALEAAAGFTPMDQDERRAALAATAGEPHIFPIPTG